MKAVLIFLHFPVFFLVGWLSYTEPIIFFPNFTRQHTKSRVIRKKRIQQPLPHKLLSLRRPQKMKQRQCIIEGTNKIYWMSYRLDVLRACCLMFPHDFKNLNAVMLLSWLKDSKDSVIDYKTTNVMSFSAVLLSQSVFNFPN